MPRKPRNSDLNEAIEKASDLPSEEKLKLIDKLKETHRKEQAKVKQQPKARIQRARQILDEQLRPKERDPLEPITLKNGSRRYGPGHADIIFKPDGKVVLMRGSRSLKADWKSVAGRLGAIAADPNDPNEREIARLKDDQKLTEDERRLTKEKIEEKIAKVRKAKYPKQRAPLEPVVSELASMPYRTKERPTDKIELTIPAWADSEATRETLGDMLCDSDSKLVELNLPDTNMALYAMLCETEKHSFERRRDTFIRQINAAWAIRHEIVHGFYQKFLTELLRLAQKLGKPPTIGQLAKAIGVDESRMSKLCKELAFDWLPKEKPGPKLSGWKRRRTLGLRKLG